MSIHDPGNPVGIHIPHAERATATNFFLATWAVAIATGDNILGLTLRASTIRQYLLAASKLITQRGNPDPLDDSCNQWTSFLLRKLDRYESVKNRREAFTDEMIAEFHRRAQSSHPDDIASCLYAWIALGRYTGFRRSEWAQTRKLSYECAPDNSGDARALIDADMLFFDSQGHLLDKLPTLVSPPLFRVDIRWRWQKNGDNGQVISFWRDESNPVWCPVQAAWRICQRARRLQIPPHEPIGKYLDAHSNSVVYLNTVEIEQIMRSIAAHATGIKDTALLQRMFGLHSIRITACNELDRLGVNDSFIQRRLRWKSLTFLTYLRNTIYSARRHNLSNISVSPHDSVLTAARVHHSMVPHSAFRP
jgi:hypothetical protein